MMFRTCKDTVRMPVNRSSKTAIAPGEERKFTCKICGACWCSETEVEIHKKSVHHEEISAMLANPKALLCHTCFRKMKSKKALIKHTKTVHLLSSVKATHVEREIFICHYCSSIFFSKTMLILHLKRGKSDTCSRLNKANYSATTQESYGCPKCHKRVRPRSLWIHLLYHGVFNVGTCPICFEVCESTSNLMKHVETHRGYYYCTICQVDSSKECYFANHITNHAKDCSEEFADNLPDQILNYFIPSNVTKRKKYKRENVIKGLQLGPYLSVCILCRKICLSAIEMKRHIYSQHMAVTAPKQVETNKYTCKCGEEFFNAILLKHHAFQMKCKAYRAEVSSLNTHEVHVTIDTVDITTDDEEDISEDVQQNISENSQDISEEVLQDITDEVQQVLSEMVQQDISENVRQIISGKARDISENSQNTTKVVQNITKVVQDLKNELEFTSESEDQDQCVIIVKMDTSDT